MAEAVVIEMRLMVQIQTLVNKKELVHPQRSRRYLEPERTVRRTFSPKPTVV